MLLLVRKGRMKAYEDVRRDMKINKGIAVALDGLDGNRQQMITVFSTIMDNLASEKKKSMSGQMTLFDLVPEEEKQDYEIRLPQLEEYSKEIKLGFEKEVLGIYLTGHPLEEYEERWRKNISAVTTDFVLDEETNEVKVKDNQKVTVGGMITESRQDRRIRIRWESENRILSTRHLKIRWAKRTERISVLSLSGK